MLDKLAELVREEIGNGGFSIGCAGCEHFRAGDGTCGPGNCPDDEGMQGARWAVLLVAKALEPQIDKWLEHIKGAQDGLTESYLLNDVAYKLLELITEASSNGCKCQKQGEEAK